MPISVQVLFSSTSAIAGAPIRGVVSVTNTGANSVAVDTMTLTEFTTMGAVFGGPSYLAPNVPGVGATPIITNGATSYFPFVMMVPSPNTPGAQASARRHHGNVFPADNTFCGINLEVRATEQVGFTTEVASATAGVPVASSVAPFPPSYGGADQFNFGANAVGWFF